jgi:hypothetical protein
MWALHFSKEIAALVTQDGTTDLTPFRGQKQCQLLTLLSVL